MRADRPPGSRRQDGQIAAPALLFENATAVRALIGGAPVTGKAALVPMAEGRPSPAEVERAALVLAQDLRAHLLDGLAHGRLGAVVSVGRQAEHLVALLGPRLAEA